MEYMMMNMDEFYRLVERCDHHDRDERYMALSDLRDLVSGIPDLRPQHQVIVKDTIMKRLDDSFNDVQSLACSCLGAVVQKFCLENAVDIVTRLGQLSISGDETVRDVYNQGLRTIIKELPSDFGAEVAKNLAPLSLQGVRDEESGLEFRIASITILGDLLKSSGSEFTHLHSEVLQCLLELLEHSQMELRSEVCNTLGHLVPVLDDIEFQTLVESILDKCTRSKKEDPFLKTFIHTLGTVSRTAGSRISPFLSDIVPLIQRFLDVDRDMNLSDIEDFMIELRESCLLGLASVVRQCPTGINEFIPCIMHLSMTLVGHDPQYDGSIQAEGAERMDMTSAEETGDEEWDDDGGWDDGAFIRDAEQEIDDTWKVRIAALKVIESFIDIQQDSLKDYFQELFELLKSRFSERDSKVQFEVFGVFCKLFKSAAIMDVSESQTSFSSSSDLEQPMLYRQRSFFFTIIQQVADVITQISSLFETKEIVSQRGALSILHQVLEIMQWKHTEPHLGYFLPYIISAMSDEDSHLRQTGMECLNVVLAHPLSEKSSKVFIDEFDRIACALLLACNDDYFKIKALSFSTMGNFIQFVYDNYKCVPEVSQTDAIVSEAFQVSLLHDVDQSVKEASLTSISICLSCMYPRYSDKLEQILETISVRLQNNTTRKAALSCLRVIVNSDHALPIQCLETFITDVAECLHFSRNNLHHESMNVLISICSNYSLSNKSIEFVLSSQANFIKSADPSSYHDIVRLLFEILSRQSLNKKMSTIILSISLDILQSTTLQVSLVDSLVSIFPLLLQAKFPMKELIKSMKDLASKSASKNNLLAISKCLCACVCEGMDDATLNSFIESLIKELHSVESMKVLNLLTMGELGSHQKLKTDRNFDGLLFSQFSSEDKLTQWSASICLGTLAAGYPEKYTEIILDKFQHSESVSLKILFLSSLRQFLTLCFRDLEISQISSISSLLFQESTSADEAVRKMSAECIGTLARAYPAFMFPRMKPLLASEGSRITMIAALQYAIVSDTDFEPDNVNIDLSDYFQYIVSEDLEICKQSLITLETIAGNNIRLLDSIGGDALKKQWIPLIYQQTKPVPELVKEVDFGGFKEYQDSHLPIRKAAFSCMFLLLKKLPHRLQLSEYVKTLQSGLNDKNEIQLISISALGFLCLNHPSVMLQLLDSLPAAFLPPIKAHLKQAKLSDNRESLEVLEKFVRLMVMLRAIPGSENSEKFIRFYHQVLKTALLKKMLNEIHE